MFKSLKSNSKLLFQVLTIIFIVNLEAKILPKQIAVPGGIVKVDLDLFVKNIKERPKAYFNNKEVLVLPDNDNKKYFALIGLPLDIKPGIYRITYHDSHNKFITSKFRVKNKTYKVSKITIKNKNMVTPDSKTLQQIANDQLKISTAINKRTINPPTQLVFMQPSVGIRTTSFGAKRIINDIAKNPHGGMDIAADIGTKVKAAGDGEVVLAEKFYLPGNMIAINHGSGLITLYAHLNRMLVNVGDLVKQGDVIGLVGNTGRVTGPHLHWSVKLNQAAVDPALFLQKDSNYG